MFSRYVLLGVLTAALAATASAQRGGGGGGRGGGMGGGGGMMSPPNRMEQLTQALNLNKDQRKEVKSILDEGQKEAAPLREQLAQARAQVAAAIDGGKSQAEIDQAVKSYADLQARMAAIEMKAFSRLFKALDADQQQKTRPVFVMMSGLFLSKNWAEPE